MILKRVLLFVIVLGGVFSAPPKLFAQSDTLLWRELSFLKKSTPWLTAQNGAGLQRIQYEKLSEICLSISRYSGGFVSYNEPPKAFVTDVCAESFYRLNSSLVFYGKMSYKSLAGRQMAGSAFIDSWRMPFDIVEDSITNTGSKHLNNYKLVGAISSKVWRKLSLGLKVDFTAANYAKYKDLRHKNSLMDMVLTAGAYLPIGSSLQLGANFYYRRNTESINFATYGNADKVYKSFIDYGAFIGRVEQFGESGYTDKNKENPFFSEHIGLGAQFEVDIAPSVTFYSSFSYARRNGYYGRKSSYSISYNQHNGDEYNYVGRLSWQQGNNRHHLNADIDIESLKNFANNYRSTVNPITNATFYEYFTPTLLADKKWSQMSFSYNGQYGVRGLSSVWDISAGAEMLGRKITVYQHPFYRKQKIASNSFFVEGGGNFAFKRSMIGAKGGFSYRRGSKIPYEDGLFTAPSEQQTPPPTMEPYFWREFHYLTAPCYTLSASLRYSFVPLRKPLKIYTESSILYKKANVENEHLLGLNRTVASLTIGCVF